MDVELDDETLEPIALASDDGDLLVLYEDKTHFVVDVAVDERIGPTVMEDVPDDTVEVDVFTANE